MRNTLIILTLLALSFSVVSAATVTGKVVGADGKPIAGANLNLLLYAEQKSLAAVSDAGGNFSSAIDLSGRQPEWLGDIIAYAPGYALASAYLRENNNIVTLSVGTTINGTVVDVDGKPLAGIPVRLNYMQTNDGSRFNVPDEWRARFTVTTERRRRLDVARHPAGGKGVIRAR